MRRFFVSEEDLKSGIIQGDEFNHLKNVLRMREGEEIIAITGDEYDYRCKILSFSKNSAQIELLEKTLNKANPNIKISLVQALCKADKLELITQKISEIGASEIQPVYFKNSDVKQNTGKIARLEKIAISATKQCKRSTILKINECITIKELPEYLKQFDVSLICNTREDNLTIHQILNDFKKVKSVAVIVGPEGGFDEAEVQKLTQCGAVSVSLGKRILRTETAGIYVLSILSDFLQV